MSARADKIDDHIRAIMADHHVPGAAVAVIKNGHVVKMKGYGLASLEFNVPVTTQTVFEIGSVSKQMTAAAIMLLVEDGKVGLDEPVSKYLTGTPESWKDVTIRHLLAHSSGIRSYTSLDGFELIKRQSVADFLKKLSPHPLEFTPGERNIYSNSGYTILAYVIESVSGKKYLDFMQERIFRPLGMNKTADRDPQFIIQNRATGYEWMGEGYTGRDWDLTDLVGAGTIVSTIEDMVKWDAALNGSRFLRPDSRKSWWTQFAFNNGQPSPYGFGWRIADIRGHKRIGHTGQTAGFAAANYRYTDAGINLIVLTNSGESGLGGMIAHDLAKLFVPSMSITAMKPMTMDSAPAELVRRALQQRIEGKPDSSIFTDNQVRAQTTIRGKDENRRLAAAGPFRSVDMIGLEASGDQRTYIYRTLGTRASFLWKVTINSDGKIASMTVDEKEFH